MTKTCSLAEFRLLTGCIWSNQEGLKGDGEQVALGTLGREQIQIRYHLEVEKREQGVLNTVEKKTRDTTTKCKTTTTTKVVTIGTIGKI